MTLAIETLQPQIVAQFKRLIAQSQLSQSYIFNGPQGAGKHDMAVWIALRLFCLNVTDGSPCGVCEECQRILAHNHPDVIELDSQAKSIKVDEIRELKQEMSKSGMETDQRVFIIDDADKMTAGASNSLLKFYEEPIAGMIVILTTTAKQRLLDTIISRAQLLNFLPPGATNIATDLTSQAVPALTAAVISQLTTSLATAEALSGDEGFKSRFERVQQLTKRLAANDLEAFVQIQTQIMPVAKELSDQQQILSMLALAYEAALRQHFGLATDLASWPGVENLSQLSSDRLTQALSALMTATQQLDQNVSFQADMEQLVLRLVQGG
ncbi:DNA replication ATPase [Lacticaseibacillus brantae DSM 23927]|uniref:DNA replication ATPase n=2 Tax=Lacticaseibacillus brantae TaxID=943673 RepID=A0A0R2B620_9LACO|nr:DNA polymerase III subunit delta' [Lacticaseibacillus brantae]KRM71510.1 DNA replication ATPase [Lacticaseibacillus brantae DSM 23927]